MITDAINSIEDVENNMGKFELLSMVRKIESVNDTYYVIYDDDSVVIYAPDEVDFIHSLSSPVFNGLNIYNNVKIISGKGIKST